MSPIEVSPEAIDRLYQRLLKEAEAAGYHLNPDLEFTKDLIKGLITNEKRYGYWACPCRLATGEKSLDLDIVCPCDYRDLDLNQHGQCYCALYVSEEIAQGLKPTSSIPERRGAARKAQVNQAESAALAQPASFPLPLPVYRCKVCGYLCAREEPPEFCPICKAKKDRFERFL
jgi:ferredoxin-thioredoxin reductase catalytic chain